MNQKITITIITLNNEEYIKGCIESAWKVADEIIVVDSFSTDKTRKIAKNLGAQVIEQSYLGDGLQRDFCVQFAKNDWILNMDADERLDGQMIKEIQAINYTEAAYDAYAFRRKNYIGSRWQRVWYPDYTIRLYHKDRCRFAPMIIHTSLATKNYQRLQGNIIHYSFKDLSDCIIRADEYSKLGAKVLFENNRKVSVWEPAVRGLVIFLKFFFLKKGFLYGYDGLTASLIGALRSYLKYAHLIEMRQNAPSSQQK
ncbi:glycosyltransferase family 2 protein [Methyloglobulus sp.]|uniref:glycosyltransferase family 2 protein n=1 Tax=Methyloglobulus sp. TaxID=2518622 RepID=UPI00398965A9